VRLDMRMPYAYKFVKSVESMAAFEAAKRLASFSRSVFKQFNKKEVYTIEQPLITQGIVEKSCDNCNWIGGDYLWKFLLGVFSSNVDLVERAREKAQDNKPEASGGRGGGRGRGGS
jgi:hypothetical protein